MKYLMCNLKSNKTLPEILKYKKEIANINLENKEFVLFPSNIYLSFFYDTNYKIGSQNISKYENGSYTGEILASQLKSLNISYTIINHCETEEKVEDCIAKIKNATKEKIQVVLCIGRETKNTDIEPLKLQIKEIFNKLTKIEIENIIIAYEPCWAINNDDIIKPSLIVEIIQNLKEFILSEYNIKTKMLYGGSINTNNFQELLNIDNLDGYLIGNCANIAQNIVNIAEMF